MSLAKTLRQGPTYERFWMDHATDAAEQMVYQDHLWLEDDREGFYLGSSASNALLFDWRGNRAQAIITIPASF